MSPSESINKIRNEYNEVLLRDLGFGDWSVWEPMITKIVETLKVDSLGPLFLTKAEIFPGKKITLYLIKRWTSQRGKYWEDLVSIDEYSGSSPYHDYKEYKLHVKTLDEFLKNLGGSDVYTNYSLIRGVFESKDYKTLQELNGIKVIITQ